MVRQVRHIYEFGRFRLIPEEQQLLRDNRLVPLTPKSFDLLVLLVENSGHLLEKGELMNQIWRDSFVEEANLSVKMSELRRALGEGPNEHQYVETVPRRGYRFVASVKERWDEGTESSTRELGEEDRDGTGRERRTPSASLAPASRRPVLFRRWPVVMVGLLLLSALLLGLNAGGLRERILGKGNPPRIQSLAVLPLENLSSDPSQEYVADGITDSLITDLAKLNSVRVISRPSVMRYKGTGMSAVEIGRELNVDAVLIGSVHRTEGQVRVEAQLIHLSGEKSLWSKTYERNLGDLLSLQADLTRDIIAAAQIKLTPPEQQRFAESKVIEPEAYDQYLRGRFYSQRQTSHDNDTAIRALEEAVAIDPTFAAAYAELAQAYVWKLFLFDPKEERKWAEKAFMASEKALALDPNLAAAYLARGRLLWTPANQFPHDKAIQDYHRALALNPNLDEVRNQLALVYCHIGAFDEALQESQKAISTNPANNLAQFRVGQTLNFQGRYEEALAILNALPREVNPPLVGHQTAWALFNLGRIDEASAVLEKLLKDYPEDTGGVFTSIQAVIAASAGHEQTAESKIKLAIEKGKGFGHFHHTAYHIACAYALMNKREQAIKWLETASKDGFPCYPLFEMDSNLDSLRQDPRFVSFLTDLKKQWEYYKTVL